MTDTPNPEKECQEIKASLASDEREVDEDTVERDDAPLSDDDSGSNDEELDYEEQAHLDSLLESDDLIAEDEERGLVDVAGLEDEGLDWPDPWSEQDEKSSEDDDKPDRSATTVLIIEDDKYVAAEYGEWLRVHDFRVLSAHTVKHAIRHAKSYRQFDYVVIDIKMPHGKLFSASETVLGRKTGVLLAQELQSLLPDSMFIALSNSDRADDVAWFEARSFAFCEKRVYDPERFAKFVRRLAMKAKPRPFIVHGHDHKTLFELKNYLQNVLKLPEPIILQEQSSKNMTIIEKFEHYAGDAEIVFALLTPDDLYDDQASTGRARQNVIFEYGYFLGRLGRVNGKVFLLYKDGVEVPSDLSGIIRIDISDGIASAGEHIRRELSDVLE